ncbi:MAG: response regulator [Microscillaceae bacterium]|jgi:CheY-like chemotaxis protein|nr:response regulator [Microscillaceae bacterium]
MTKLKRILIIDDNEIDNLISQKIIKDADLTEQVSICESGNSALSYLRKSMRDNPTMVPDLILLDLNMPLMDGWDFLQELDKINFKSDKSKIFILTCSIDRRDISKAQRDPRVTEYITKPLTADKVRFIQEQCN